MKNQANKQFNENGNVLIIILITIILLAALTFTFMRGDSGSNKTILTKGEVEIATSQIMKYSKSIENAIKKLQLVNNCSENEISFDNSVVAGYANANSPADKSCHVFDVNGGGLSWISPIGNDGSEWVFSGGNIIRDIGLITKTDLAILLPNINKDLCLEINKSIGLSGITTDFDSFSTGPFTGNLGSMAVLEAGGNPSLCLEAGVGSDQYYFFHVLIER